MVRDSIATGADVSCFSGDKLIGGPQCGIIVGKRTHIEKIKKNPLTRALRCDKMTNVVLEATLQLFLLNEDIFIQNHGVFGVLLKPLDAIKKQATRCARSLRTLFQDKLDIAVRSDMSEVGGGTLSTEQLPTYVVAIRSKTQPIQNLARALRQYEKPVFGRVTEDTLLLDFRTVLKGEEKIIIEAFKAILSP